jgi:hypothetical protein
VENIMREKCNRLMAATLYSLIGLIILLSISCGGGSSSGGSSGSGTNYYAVKITNGYTTAQNGPFSTLSKCQEFLASMEGQAPAWQGATCRAEGTFQKIGQ